MKRVAIALAAIACATPALAWIPEIQEDRLDGKSSLVLWRNSADGEMRPQRQPSKHVTGMFVIRCQAKAVKFIISVPGALVASSLSRVDYRVGELAPVRNQRWESSSDMTAVGSWKTGPAVLFLRAAAKSDELFVRITDDVFGITELTFDVSGLAEEMKARTSECGAIF